MANTDSTAEDMQALIDGGSAVVPVYGTYDSVEITHLEQSDNIVRVWVDGNTDESPDYVIVNPPTEVVTGLNTSIEDPLGAIAQAIHGAKN